MFLKLLGVLHEEGGTMDTSIWVEPEVDLAYSKYNGTVEVEDTVIKVDILIQIIHMKDSMHT